MHFIKKLSEVLKFFKDEGSIRQTIREAELSCLKEGSLYA